jgi:hypothetical protein
MLKKIIATLRWGKLSKEQKEELKTLTLKQVLSRPYLAPKLYHHW